MIEPVAKKYQHFVDRGKLHTNKSLSQCYRTAKLVSTIKHFYMRHHHLVDLYNVAVSELISDLMASVKHKLFKISKDT